MTNVLVVKANNRPATEGVSSKMYEVFMDTIGVGTELNINTFDVFKEDMPYFGQDFFEQLVSAQNLTLIRLMYSKKTCRISVKIFLMLCKNQHKLNR